MKSFQYPLGFIFSFYLLLTTGCATTGSLSEDDPLEPFNRVMFAVHQPIEKVVIRPLAGVYETVTPDVFQEIVSNFFNNIGDLFSGIAGVLQGKLDSAGNDFGRFILNTGFGLGGIFDWASEAGIPRGDQDFGMVLAHYGVGPRPYLFLPLVGPLTLRDGAGEAVRAVWSPIDWVDVPVRNTLWVLRALDGMSSGVKALDQVDAVAIDRYTFIRNAWLQRRAYQTTGSNIYNKVDDEIEDLDALMNESADAPAPATSPTEDSSSSDKLAP